MMATLCHGRCAKSDMVIRRAVTQAHSPSHPVALTNPIPLVCAAKLSTWVAFLNGDSGLACSLGLASMLCKVQK